MNSRLNVYLSFAGQAREAMNFYQTIFGGELAVTTFGEAGVSYGPPDDLMHAQLTVDGQPFLMASDGMDEKELKGFSLALGGNDGNELRGYFEKLSAGGTVTKPIEKEAWGDEFGMVTDKFGVNWMVNIAST